jgi:ABC-2 type transport system permease protein
MVVARKDYRDAIQSRSLWGLTTLLVVFTAGLAFALNEFSLLSLFWPFFLAFFGPAGAEGLRTIQFIHFFLGPAEILIPMVALVITHKSIAGEIESGTVKFLLSVPLTRWDALIGKMIGRTAVLSTALVAGLTAAGILVAVFAGRLDFPSYLFMIIVTVLFGAAYASIGVNLSALASTESRAVVYAVGAYVFMRVVMTYAKNVAYFIAEGTLFPPRVGHSGPPDAPGWFYLIDHLKPSGAYKAIVTQTLGGEPSFAPAFPDGIPIYLEPGPAILILLLWIILPIGVGYYRLKGTDIV